MERCKVCKDVVTLEERTVMSAFGRPLFVCHKRCAAVVQDGVAAVGRVALAASSVALKKRAPKTLKAFELMRTMLAARNEALQATVTEVGKP